MKRVLSALAVLAGLAAVVPSGAEAAISARPAALAPLSASTLAVAPGSGAMTAGSDLLQPVQYWRERRRYREWRREQRYRRWEARRRYYRRY